MKTLIFLLLGASSLAFGQSLTSETKHFASDFSASGNSASSSIQVSENQTDKVSDNELTVTYEDKKLKKAYVYSSDGKLVQKSSKILVDEKKLNPGQYLIKVDFLDGTSTSAKFVKN